MNAAAVETSTPDQVGDASATRLSQVDRVAMMNAQTQAEHLQASADFLTERQRKSGVRTRQCSTGCHAIYDAGGHFIARTAPPGTQLGLGAVALRRAARRMAMSEELLDACRLVDADWTAHGQVGANTVAGIRDLIAALDAA